MGAKPLKRIQYLYLIFCLILVNFTFQAVSKESENSGDRKSSLENLLLNLEQGKVGPFLLKMKLADAKSAAQKSQWLLHPERKDAEFKIEQQGIIIQLAFQAGNLILLKVSPAARHNQVTPQKEEAEIKLLFQILTAKFQRPFSSKSYYSISGPQSKSGLSMFFQGEFFLLNFIKEEVKAENGIKKNWHLLLSLGPKGKDSENNQKRERLNPENGKRKKSYGEGPLRGI
jgi:hypothetical protein